MCKSFETGHASVDELLAVLQLTSLPVSFSEAPQLFFNLNPLLSSVWVYGGFEVIVLYSVVAVLWSGVCHVAGAASYTQSH